MGQTISVVDGLKQPETIPSATMLPTHRHYFVGQIIRDAFFIIKLARLRVLVKGTILRQQPPPSQQLKHSGQPKLQLNSSTAARCSAAEEGRRSGCKEVRVLTATVFKYLRLHLY
jgi:hypothetical protein